MKLIALITLFLFNISLSDNDFLLLRSDKKGHYCFVNKKGDTLIRLHKYSTCYTDTFRNFAIVSSSKSGLIAIDRQQKVLFKVFLFDNGPDYISGGYFRVIKNGKIGYADKNGIIRISPQYSCAFPFQYGIAKVSNDCTSKADGEHSFWISNSWFYIDKTGKKVMYKEAK